MNRRLTITATVLLLIAILWIFLRPGTPRPDGGGDTENIAARPPRHRPGETPPSPGTEKQDEAMISFPGMKPLPYHGKWTVDCGELIEKYNFPIPEVDIWHQGGRKRNTLEIYTDEEGRILRIAKNRGAYPSVSGNARIPEMFRKWVNTEIVRFGNDVANIHNRKFMCGLLSALGEMGGMDSTKLRDGAGEMSVNFEIEIVPVTFRRVLGKGTESIPDGVDLAGLLVKRKQPGVGTEERMHWKDPIRPEDARNVKWLIYPINLNPDADYFSMVSDNRIGISDVYELKIRRPEDPPEPPLPPLPIPNGK